MAVPDSLVGAVGSGGSGVLGGSACLTVGTSFLGDSNEICCCCSKWNVCFVVLSTLVVCTRMILISGLGFGGGILGETAVEACCGFVSTGEGGSGFLVLFCGDCFALPGTVGIALVGVGEGCGGTAGFLALCSDCFGLPGALGFGRVDAGEEGRCGGTTGFPELFCDDCLGFPGTLLGLEFVVDAGEGGGGFPTLWDDCFGLPGTFGFGLLVDTAEGGGGATGALRAAFSSCEDGCLGLPVGSNFGFFKRDSCPESEMGRGFAVFGGTGLFLVNALEFAFCCCGFIITSEISFSSSDNSSSEDDDDTWRFNFSRIVPGRACPGTGARAVGCGGCVVVMGRWTLLLLVVDSLSLVLPVSPPSPCFSAAT